MTGPRLAADDDGRWEVDQYHFGAGRVVRRRRPPVAGVPMAEPRMAADVLAEHRSVIVGHHEREMVDALLAGADMVALVRTDAGVEVRGLDQIAQTMTDPSGRVTFFHDAYRLVDAPVPAQEDDHG